MESNLPSWIADRRIMFGDGTTRRTSVLQMVTNRPNSLAVLIAIAVLIAAFGGHAQAAAPSPTLSRSIGPCVGRAAGHEYDIRLAAAPVPKISVPRVHVNPATHPELPKLSAPQLRVNAATHVSTGNADRVTGASAVKFKSAHRFHEGIGARGKAVAGNNGAGEGAAIRSLNFTHMQVEYKPQGDNGSAGKSGTGQSK